MNSKFLTTREDCTWLVSYWFGKLPNCSSSWFWVIQGKTENSETEESIVLSKLSLYLVMPAAILSAFQVDFKPEIQVEVWCWPLWRLLPSTYSCSIGHISGSLFHFEEIDIASIIYSNAGNLIIPIVTAVLGTEWVIYSTAFLSVQLIFLWTHCKLMFSKEKKEKKPHFRKIILNVNMIAILLACCPCCREAACRPSSCCCWNSAMPLVWWITARKYYSSPSWATVTPAASTVTQFAQVHDKNAAYAGAINIMTTLLCIVTMPIFVILYYIWKKLWKLLKTSTSMFQGFFVKIYG